MTEHLETFDLFCLVNLSDLSYSVTRVTGGGKSSSFH